ncbi:MAG: VanZ family protein [Bacteroidota bacterium]
MQIFGSEREKKLWQRVFFVLLAIYLSLGFAGGLVDYLEEKEILSIGFLVSFFLVIAAILATAIKRKLAGIEIWLLIGIIGIYTVLIVRMGISPVERTHLFEYSLLAILIKDALEERSDQLEMKFSPWLGAFFLSTILGCIDEGIQYFLPDRVFDLRDILFNTLAAFMALFAQYLMKGLRERIQQSK